MKVYLRVFINYKQNNWARLVLIAEFAYNNAKHASIEYMPFEPNCKYHSYVSYEEDINPYSKSKAADELTKKLKYLMAVCRENLQHTQELQKRAHNKLRF